MNLTPEIILFIVCMFLLGYIIYIEKIKGKKRK